MNRRVAGWLCAAVSAPRTFREALAGRLSVLVGGSWGWRPATCWMVVDRAGVGVFVKVPLSTAAVPFVVIAPMVLSTQQEEIVYAGQPALEVGDEVVRLKLNSWFRASVPCAHCLHRQQEDPLFNAREAGPTHGQRDSRGGVQLHCEAVTGKTELHDVECGQTSPGITSELGFRVGRT